SSPIMPRPLSRYFLGLLCSVALMLPGCSWFRQEPVTAVKDLHYGVALYALYQDQYFDALTELMIGEEMQRLDYHGDFAKILRGGIHLAYGMDIEAEALFDALVQDKGSETSATTINISEENEARAWFYLGKLVYKKGDFRRAQTAWSRVDKRLTNSLHEEFGFLSQHSSMKASVDTTTDAKEAIAASELSPPNVAFSPKLDKHSPWRLYRDLNEQMAQLRNSVTAQSQRKVAERLLGIAAEIDDFDKLEQQELLALRDRIFTTCGFVFLQQRAYTDAIAAFKRVRQQSVFVGQALLGYGWAAAQSGNYEQALVPWQVLQTRSMTDSSTHEALLAVPFVYEKNGANREALHGYEKAIQKMQIELEALEALSLMLSEQRDAGTLPALFDNAGFDRPIWLDSDAVNYGKLPENLRSRFWALLSQNINQTTLKHLHDVRALKRNIGEWDEKLNAFHGLLEARMQRADDIVGGSEYAKYQEKLFELQQLFYAIDAQHQSNVIEQDAIALLPKKEKAQYQRILNAEKTFAAIDALTADQKSQSKKYRIPQGKKLKEQRRRLRLVKGVADWNAALAMPARQWAVRSDLRQLEEGLALAKKRVEGFPYLVDEQQQQAANFRRLVYERDRMQRQLLQIDDLRQRAERQLAAELTTEIAFLSQQLTDYLGQAKLAKARLMDTMSLTVTTSDEYSETGFSTTGFTTTDLIPDKARSQPEDEEAE
ncbi:hypothetical protein GYB62_01025, partial [bacterium]|nr:hypothetical protein [bacterium]